MKLCLLISALVLSVSSYADMIEGLEPTLRYSKDLKIQETFRTHNINVVVESYRFPKGPQRKKFEVALGLLDQIMNSAEFKRRVISYVRSDGKREYRKNYLWRNSDQRLSNADVYEILMAGNEKMRPGTEGEMNLNSWVKVCKWWQRPGIWCRKVIGSTSPSNSKWIKLNWKFYRKYEVNNMVANMVHEWIHLLGFLHAKDVSRLELTEEVPYVVGSIAGQMAKEILEHGKPLSID